MGNRALCLLIVVISLFMLVSCSSKDSVLTEENARSILNKQYANIEVKSILHIEAVSNAAVVFYESQEGLSHVLLKKQGSKWVYAVGSGNILIDTNKEETFGMNNDEPNKLLVYSGIVKTPNVTRISVNQNGQEGVAKIIKGKYILWFVIFDHLEPPKKGSPDVLKIDYYDYNDLICTAGYNYSISGFSTNSDSNLNLQQIQVEDLQLQEMNFVKVILKAINENDVSTITKYNDCIYGKTGNGNFVDISKGIELYHKYFENEKIERVESGKKLEWTFETPNTSGKQYYFISKSGRRRDIIIKCYNNDKIYFTYIDPLIYYGPETVTRVDSYFRAIQAKDIGYLYNYICMAQEDSCSVEYSDPNHNREYENMAINIIKNYEKAFKLDTMKCEFTGKISEVSNSSLIIEFEVSGENGQGKANEHYINGVFESPMWGINDNWFKEVNWKE